jgi:hypothetical protein
MRNLLNERDLMEWTGYQRREFLANWLKERGIHFFHGKGGQICSTTAAVNAVLAPQANAAHTPEITESVGIEF